MSSNPDFREIERQLSCPDGAKGVEMGAMMNETNIGMTMASVEALELKRGNHILELGHGNGGHIQRVLSLADDLHYTGLEISETMHREASVMASAAMITGCVNLLRYPGKTFPVTSHSIDRFFTVNTIYFWSDPRAMLNEIARVVTPDARIIITYAQKDFMRGLPFVGDKFTLYNDDDFSTLVDGSALELAEIRNLREHIKSKSGEFTDRHYSVALLKTSNS